MTWEINIEPSSADITTITYKNEKYTLSYMIFYNNIAYLSVNDELFHFAADKKDSKKQIETLAKQIGLDDNLRDEIIAHLPSAINIPQTTFGNSSQKRKKNQGLPKHYDRLHSGL